MLDPVNSVNGGSPEGNETRPRRTVTGVGGMAAWAPPPDPPTHPHQKNFPGEKNETYQRGPKVEVGFRFTNFFLAPELPPVSVNSLFSRGLGET